MLLIKYKIFNILLIHTLIDHYVLNCVLQILPNLTMYAHLQIYFQKNMILPHCEIFKIVKSEDCKN